MPLNGEDQRLAPLTDLNTVSYVLCILLLYYNDYTGLHYLCSLYLLKIIEIILMFLKCISVITCDMLCAISKSMLLQKVGEKPIVATVDQSRPEPVRNACNG